MMNVIFCGITFFLITLLVGERLYAHTRKCLICLINAEGLIFCFKVTFHKKDMEVALFTSYSTNASLAGILTSRFTDLQICTLVPGQLLQAY